MLRTHCLALVLAIGCLSPADAYGTGSNFQGTISPNHSMSRVYFLYAANTAGSPDVYSADLHSRGRLWAIHASANRRRE